MNHSADADDRPALVREDGLLAPYTDEIRARRDRFDAARAVLAADDSLTTGYRQFGFTRFFLDDGTPAGIAYAEWAPGAQALSLIGDFNGWDREACPLSRSEYGVWRTFLPTRDFPGLTHGSRVKVHVVGADGSRRDRIPAWAQRVVQVSPPHGEFVAEVWLPPTPFGWQHPAPPPLSPAPGGEGLRIYEAHIGMAGEDGRVGTFAEFAQNVLPRIVAGGYNAVQLMAIQEHPYYGSFGYHVSSLYAVSSRFGTPEDLKALIDQAHGVGVRVFLDVVHSHAVKNIHEGLSDFDGTDYQYFHAGSRGAHSAWDSRLFDYAKGEVQRFLLSNVRFWRDEFRFDGFRFDGVTSMLYRDHGLDRVFTGYHEYFGPNIDPDAVLYLQLANAVAHDGDTPAVTIAEEVSGMPGVARPASEGGLGFDYRLAMGVPDYWIKLLKERRDEDWNLREVWHTLLDRRRGESHVGYAESHDQALVGDQTLAFRMMGAAMYDQMASDHTNIVVERGVALLKIIRLLTFSVAGEAWLNFMGNEFGHPEWVDFPREGNDWSFHYARRQWSLADNPLLRYGGLRAFDAALMDLDKTYDLLTDPLIEQLAVHEDTKQLVYRRGPLVFVVNLHPTHSVTALRIPVPDHPPAYRVLLSTDDATFAGPNRAPSQTVHPVQPIGMYGRNQTIEVYLPSRCALVLVPEDKG